jgi:hypothetical protein
MQSKRISYDKLININFIFLISCSEKKLEFIDNDRIDSLIPQNEEVIKKTFKKLAGTLKSAIAEKGFDGAISTCKLEAPKIQKDFSEYYGSTLRRTSSKIRNPNNSPDDWDKLALDYFTQNPESVGKHVKANGTRYYKPIKIKALCLNCHGDPKKNINPKTFAKIKELYPNDQATGYKLGDLRGLWVFEDELN